MRASLLYGYALGEVTRTVGVEAARYGDRVRYELERDDAQDGLERLNGLWNDDNIFRMRA